MRHFFLIFLLVLSFSYNAVPTPNPLRAETSGKINHGEFEGMKGVKGFQPCGVNSLGKLLSVYLTGCDEAPCKLNMNSKINLFVEGMFPKPHASLNATFFARIGNVEYPTLTLNACDRIVFGGKCPFVPESKYVFSLEWDLRKYSFLNGFQIPMNAGVLKVKDENTQEEICAQFAAKLISN